MTSCPRCGGQLSLQPGGLFRDAHGVFLPASALRRQADYRVAAELTASLQRGAKSVSPCPSCRSALREVELTGPPTLKLDGCSECGGFWFDEGELERLRAAMLSRKQTKPRTVGGYGGTAIARGASTSPVAEGIYSSLTGLGGFLG